MGAPEKEYLNCDCSSETKILIICVQGGDLSAR